MEEQGSVLRHDGINLMVLILTTSLRNILGLEGDEAPHYCRDVSCCLGAQVKIIEEFGLIIAPLVVLRTEFIFLLLASSLR